MQPRGPLMKEHRLIERVVALLGDELEREKSSGQADHDFILQAAEFMRTYADRCHHGKEEDILFRDLQEKDLSDEHQEMLQRLLDDHAFAREHSGALVEATERYAGGDGDALGRMTECLQALVDLYPAHIATEDDEFFPAAMDYLDDDEQAAMLDEFREFDRELIHEKYRAAVEDLEADDEA